MEDDLYDCMEGLGIEKDLMIGHMSMNHSICDLGQNVSRMGINEKSFL
jgi:hypothetical protein